MACRVDCLFVGARLATLAGAGSANDSLGIVAPGAIAVANGDIVYAGPAADLPACDAAETVDCEGRWITPGLVDCHTHLVFAGDRSDEFERRLAGEAYADIARAGGGILSTVRATRAASEDALVESALRRLDRLIADGVTTVEIKSGYGLTLEAECAMLRAARRLERHRPIRVETTFLGAHAVPPDTERTAYLDALCEVMIPTVAAERLASAVDGFCETIAFSPIEIDRLFRTAAAYGLKLKLHAEQLSNLGGTALAARHGALSADHLEYLDEAGVAAMRASGMVAVLLPGSTYVLREARHPPVEKLRAAGVPMAVSTDANPGTSPLLSLRFAAHLACTLERLTVPEALAGITREAARALGLSDRIGTLQAGKRADFCIWDVERLAELIAWIGGDPLWRRVWGGK